VKVGLTGGSGLIGWHLRARVHGRAGLEVALIDRVTLSDDDALAACLATCDAVVHLAGMNRGDPAEVESTNDALADAVVRACERAPRPPRVVFASSIQIHRNTPYGRSKRRAGERLAAWAARAGSTSTNLVLPHVFGEGGRPFHNSVVSTFCHQIAHGETPAIIEDGALELLHAQDAAARIGDALADPVHGDVEVPGRPMRVSEMLARVRDLAAAYAEGVVADLRDPLDLQLFNTYRSYLFPRHYPVPIERHRDPRGSLFEAVRTRHGGQCFLSTTRPGITRGNHYHLRKIERFLVVRGEARIRVRRLFASDVTEFSVRGDEPAYVDMPTLHTHDITNVGDADLLTLFWAHEIFDPAAPDTIPEPV
jgi:UDP-2-acetamido-2,6-beta-L-arabino-hexul-4-ose reductase